MKNGDAEDWEEMARIVINLTIIGKSISYSHCGGMQAGVIIEIPGWEKS
jgi:hypothetical protein